jgi:biopolymer transport protein ExbD
MARLFRHKAEDEGMAIDLTPMLDVVFIMLIFFIVTASFVKEVGVHIEHQQSAQNQEENKEQKNILIKVMADNQVWLENRRIDIRSVRANVERLHAENPKAAVIIQADPQATNDTLVKIADQSREANVFDVSLIIEQ